MSLSPYRVALVGVGGISRSHSVACSLSDRARIVAVCDISQKSIDRYQELFPGVESTYLDLDLMLAEEEIDLAIICAWGPYHAEIGTRLAKSGKVRSILCEKPFTQTASQAECLVAAVKDSGAVIVEAFKFRHHPMHLKAMGLVEAGKIGQPMTVRSTFCTNKASIARKPDVNWRFNKKKGGGSIFDLACYNIHHARWVIGEEPVEVFATGRPGFEVDDSANIQLIFPGGGIAQITVGFETSSSQEFEVMGTTGILRTEAAWNNETVPTWLDHRTTGRTERFHFDPVNQFQPQLEHMCDVLDGKTEPCISAQNSIAQMKVIDAIYESFESRRAVRL